MRKPEILAGKSNGSRHSVWEASELVLFQANQVYLVLVCSIYFVEAHSNTTSNFVVIYLRTRFPRGGLFKW